MGNRRLGRKRLYALEKLGQTQTKTVGAAMETSLGNQTGTRNGSEIITEIEIDLASSGGAAHSFATDTAIGVSSSSGTHGSATVVQIDVDVHGAVTDVELVCLEVPTAGDPDIDLYIHSSAVNASGSVAGTKLINHGDWTYIGESDTASLAAESDDQYVYLATGATTNADYTGGKYVLRLYGHEIFSDL